MLCVEILDLHYMRNGFRRGAFRAFRLRMVPLCVWNGDPEHSQIWPTAERSSVIGPRRPSESLRKSRQTIHSNGNGIQIHSSTYASDLDCPIGVCFETCGGPLIPSLLWRIPHGAINHSVSSILINSIPPSAKR